MRRPFARVVARDGHQSEHFAAMDERDEKTGGEMPMIAALVGRLLFLGVIHRDRALLEDRAAARRVLGKGRIRMELLDRSIRAHGVSVGEIGLRGEYVKALDRQ